jgi:protein-S-isoprenylcysteine O-methyltransferase Ste14
MIVATVAAASILLNMIMPLHTPASTSLRVAGCFVGSLGVALDLWAILTMRSARTNILPHRAADHLVVRGPFAFTRNPIYAGNTLLLFGVGLYLGNFWFVIFGLTGAIAVDRLAIRREERHLAQLFGNE